MRGCRAAGPLNLAVRRRPLDTFRPSLALAFKKLRKRINEQASRSEAEVPELEKQAKAVEGRIARLAEAIMSSEEPPGTLVRMMAEQEKELGAIRQRIAALKASGSTLDLEARRLEKEARERLKDFQGLLQRNPEEARKVLEAVLVGPLVWTPIETKEGRRYEIRGKLDPTGVLSGGSNPPIDGVPNGIRTRVTALKGPCPGPG
jgi:hypothetical protein